MRISQIGGDPLTQLFQNVSKGVQTASKVVQSTSAQAQTIIG